MKKATVTSLVLLIMVIISASVRAQDNRKEANEAEPAFDIGDKTIALSIGFGSDYSYNYYGGYAPVILPAFGVSYDQGILEAGPGIVGIGGIIVGQFSHYNGPYGINATYDNYIIGARGTWHLTILKNKNNKFDPYGGVLIGLRFFNYYENYDHYTSNSVNPAFGLFVGAKYNFAAHVGAFAELGVDVSLLRFGLNFNF